MCDELSVETLAVQNGQIWSSTLRMSLLLAACLFVSPLNMSADEVREWSNAQKRTFLEKAQIVDATPIGKGVTRPWRLTLSDGVVSHDAAFQSVEISKTQTTFTGRYEIDFQDSYRFNLAAYELASLLGFPDLVPVTVKRRWRGKAGALSWWVDSRGDEGERAKKNEQPPDAQHWSDELYRVRVFTALVEDTDRNGGNLLITPDWDLVMIDFSRAFRRSEKLIRQASLRQCDRKMLDALESLQRDELDRVLGDFIAPVQREAIWKRRGLLVTHFQNLVDAMGEERVIY